MKIKDNTSIHTTLKFHLLAKSSLVSLQLDRHQLFYAAENDENFRLLPKVHEKILDNNIVEELEKFYVMLYPTYEIEHFYTFFFTVEFSCFVVTSFHSKRSRNTRNSIYIASWPTDIESINCFMRVCQINYFLRHNISMKHKVNGKILKSSHILCSISWFKSHVKQEWFGASAIVSKAEAKNDSYLNFIPLQRLIAACALALFH